MTCYDKIARTWKMPEWLGVGEDFQDGFFAGIALFLVLFLLLVLIKRVALRKRGTVGIAVGGGMGELFITTSAVREFVARLLGEFDAVHLRAFKLVTRGKKVTLTLEISVAARTGLPPLRDAIQERVITEMEEKLGLSAPPKVNLKIRSFQVSDTSPPSEPAMTDVDPELATVD
ncbi:MAG: hypothetical protein RRC34_02450 [Lentisphaeria bacterium]|nr:hypothetical protein [Lentisphaeria bacterium]